MTIHRVAHDSLPIVGGVKITALLISLNKQILVRHSLHTPFKILREPTL